MTKLPQLKPKEVAKALGRMTFEPTRTTGSHLRLVHSDGRKVTVPLHNQPLPKGTLKSILRQAQITVEDLTENL